MILKLEEEVVEKLKHLKMEIFFYKELTNKKSGRDLTTGVFYRRKEDIDYIKTTIDLESRRTLDIRKKKLKKVNDLQYDLQRDSKTFRRRN